MKIAVQLFGHLRTYDRCYGALARNLLSLHDCDVFMHTWDTLDHVTQTWHDFRVDRPNVDVECVVRQTYLPKRFEVEHQNVEDLGVIESRGRKIGRFGMQAMIASMTKCNALRERYQHETGVKYDYVVMLRPDVKLLKPLHLEVFKRINDEGSWYTSGWYNREMGNGVINDIRCYTATDVLFFASPETMSKVFSRPLELFGEIVHGDCTCTYGPEASFMTALSKMGVQVRLTDYAPDDAWTIVRGAVEKRRNDVVVGDGWMRLAPWTYLKIKGEKRILKVFGIKFKYRMIRTSDHELIKIGRFAYITRCGT